MANDRGNNDQSQINPFKNSRSANGKLAICAVFLELSHYYVDHFICIYCWIRTISQLVNYVLYVLLCHSFPRAYIVAQWWECINADISISLSIYSLDDFLLAAWRQLLRIAANGTIKREFERDVEIERLVHVPRTFYVRVYVVEYKAYLLVSSELLDSCPEIMNSIRCCSGQKPIRRWTMRITGRFQEQIGTSWNNSHCT